MRKTLFSLLNIDCWSTVTRISGPIAKTAVRMRRHRCQKRVLLIEICIMFLRWPKSTKPRHGKHKPRHGKRKPRHGKRKPRHG